MPALRSNGTDTKKHAGGGAAFNASLSTSRELKPKATLLLCRMRALLEIRFSWRAQVVAGLSR